MTTCPGVQPVSGFSPQGLLTSSAAAAPTSAPGRRRSHVLGCHAETTVQQHLPWGGTQWWRPVHWPLPWRAVQATACDEGCWVYFECGLAALDWRIRRYDWHHPYAETPLEPMIAEVVAKSHDEVVRLWERLLSGSST